MGIFSSIKDAIFGHKDDTAATPAVPSGQATGIAPGRSEPVDVEAALEAKAADSKQDLNWRSSIVDLMKLVGIDSSLTNRKALAQELGYTGDLDGSAEMNIWLHKATMRELEKNGGRVPAAMLD
ncbi:MAG: DUF3597 domain-containing protein [Sphingomonadales bacterium]|nr:DUF3597 domain-containing protein [Sphingomonadales bacterium]